MRKLGILKENEGLNIVSLVPEHVEYLSKDYSILLEKGAGEKAGFTDMEYEAAGARIVSNRGYLLNKADILITYKADVDLTIEDGEKVVIGCYNVLDEYSSVLQFTGKPIDLYSLALLPKTTKTESMDVLSSLNAVSGYQAVIKGFDNMRVVSPMISGTWGTTYPAKVLVLGAGVAGLQAIATAKRLGALVNAFAFQKQTKREIEMFGRTVKEVSDAFSSGPQSSLEFKTWFENSIENQKLICEYLKEADLVIASLEFTGKKAPKILTKEMIKEMKNGSVIIDMASATGGNADFSRDGELVDVNGVKVIGDSNLFNTPSKSSSILLSSNLTKFLNHFFKSENVRFQDGVLSATLITNQGKIVHHGLCEELKNY